MKNTKVFSKGNYRLYVENGSIIIESPEEGEYLDDIPTYYLKDRTAANAIITLYKNGFTVDKDTVDRHIRSLGKFTPEEKQEIT